MNPAEQLLQWVTAKHQGQLKKYSGEPYINHLSRVAKLAKDAVEFGYEIGLCHDLLEDTATSAAELRKILLTFGYSEHRSDFITAAVLELTDVFTASAYPELSRESRKEKETARMISISAAAQTVKYADLIDNMKLVIQYEPEQVSAYLLKKFLLLHSMNKGNEELRLQALALTAAEDNPDGVLICKDI